jgi:hypothetical protein
LPEPRAGEPTMNGSFGRARSSPPWQPNVLCPRPPRPPQDRFHEARAEGARGGAPRRPHAFIGLTSPQEPTPLWPTALSVSAQSQGVGKVYGSTRQTPGMPHLHAPGFLIAVATLLAGCSTPSTSPEEGMTNGANQEIVHEIWVNETFRIGGTYDPVNGWEFFPVDGLDHSNCLAIENARYAGVTNVSMTATFVGTTDYVKEWSIGLVGLLKTDVNRVAHGPLPLTLQVAYTNESFSESPQIIAAVKANAPTVAVGAIEQVSVALRIRFVGPELPRINSGGVQCA